MFKLCLIGDDLLTRNAYIKALSSFEGLEVVSDFDKISDCLEFLENNIVDLVLIDILKNNQEDLELVRTLRQKFKDTKVIIKTGEQDHVLKVLSVGANGYVLKNISLELLVRVIRDVIDGQLVISNGVVDILSTICQEKMQHSQSSNCCHLTDREKQILNCISKGKSNNEIGKELCLSPFTVKNYVSRIFEKLEAKDRTHATAMAIHYGLVN